MQQEDNVVRPPNWNLQFKKTFRKFAERAFSVAGLSESDSTAVFERKLKVSCFALFLLSNFLIFSVTILIRYCTLFYIVTLSHCHVM